MNADLVFGVVALAVAATYYALARAIPSSLLDDVVGSRGLPMVYGVVLGGSGAPADRPRPAGSAVRSSHGPPAGTVPNAQDARHSGARRRIRRPAPVARLRRLDRPAACGDGRPSGRRPQRPRGARGRVRRRVPVGALRVAARHPAAGGDLVLVLNSAVLNMPLELLAADHPRCVRRAWCGESSGARCPGSRRRSRWRCCCRSPTGWTPPWPS